VLLGICIYATAQIGFKTLLAMINFGQWLIGHMINKCCESKFDVPKNNIIITEKIFDDLKKSYRESAKEASSSNSL
jgi:hypothetical protein